MCVNNLSKVAHDSAAAGIEPAFSSWTTATLFSPAFQPATSSDYSQCSTQLYVWWPAHRDMIMHSLFCATVIGCLSSSASSTNCAWWSTGACTATLHPTCGTWSRRLLMQPSEVVSDRLHPAQSQCHEQCHRSATGHSLRLSPAHGTDCHHHFVAFILLLFLNDNWRHFYSIVLLTDTILLGALVLWHLRRPNLDVLE